MVPPTTITFPLPPTSTNYIIVPNTITDNPTAPTAAVTNNNSSTVNGSRQELKSIPRDTQSTHHEEVAHTPAHPPTTETHTSVESLVSINNALKSMCANIQNK